MCELLCALKRNGYSMETLTQTALIFAAQAGDRTAFDTLVKPYQRELLVHCYRMLGSVHDAEDLVQETLIRAWEKRSTFTTPGSYRALPTRSHRSFVRCS